MQDNISNIKGTYRKGSLSELQAIHLRKTGCFYDLWDAVFPGCGQQHYIPASIHHCSATIVQQQHNDLPSHTSGAQNPLWVVHLSKIIRIIKKDDATWEGWKQRTGKQSKDTGYTHTQNTQITVLWLVLKDTEEEDERLSRSCLG